MNIDNDELADVVAFLCGEKPLQGRWFGEKYEGVPTYWWRNSLRIAFAAQRQALRDEMMTMELPSGVDETCSKLMLEVISTIFEDKGEKDE